MTRIYQAMHLDLNQVVALSETASHHLSRVLRAKIGETLTLFNGKGGEYSAVIKQIDKKTVTVEILSFQAQNRESPLSIHLAQGIARGDKMDNIIQKAVELGITHITPVITERCNVHLNAEREAKRYQHWQAIIISACEQSGRNTLPLITPPSTLSTYLKHDQAALKFVLSPHVTEKLPPTVTPSDRVSILIGPEGGLSEAEVSQAIACGFHPLNLGPRILRTETASIAAMSLLQSRFGDIA